MSKSLPSNQVLIIDHDDEIRRFLIILLISEGFEIDFASDGRGALEKIALNDYGAVLCDINLPDMNWMSLLNKIKTQAPFTEPIMISYKNNMTEVINALRLGAFDYLLKPFENIDLITNALNNALESYTIKKQNLALIEELRSTNKNLESLVAQKTASLTRSNEELTQMNAQLVAMQETLLEEKKLSSLGSITAGFAHEINNPIQNIMIYSELLMAQLDKEGKGHQFAKTIYNEVDRIANITHKILNFSRKNTTPNKEQIYLKSFFDDLIKTNENILSTKNITTTNLVEVTHTLYCDRSEWYQICLNLLINAVDAMEENGTIQLSTKLEANDIAIYISDTGKGIPVDEQHRIFEPFFTTKEVGKGTGLGLYITYNLVKKNRGLIILQQSDERGTTFKMTFPREY